VGPVVAGWISAKAGFSMKKWPAEDATLGPETYKGGREPSQQSRTHLMHIVEFVDSGGLISIAQRD
jgi:hypothetical protein